MPEHPTDDQLAIYRDDADDSPEIKVHLDQCTPCRERLADLREIEELLGDEASWPEDGDVPVPAPETLVAIAARNRREDAEAEALLSPKLEKFLAESSFAFLWDDIGSRPAYHTAGVVRKLADAADRAQYSVPRRALILAETASTIVEKLSPATYSATELAALRGVSWKQIGNASRQLGRFKAVHEALDHAEQEYRKLPRPELDLATITFMRATAYTEQGIYDRAQLLANASSTVFFRLGQNELFFRSRQLEGWIAFEQRDLHRAQLIFESVLAYGETTHDPMWLARGAQGLGNCYLEQDKFSHAARHLQQSMLAFRDLKIRVEEIRSRWGLALITKRQALYRTAISQLQDVRDRFSDLGATTDAALVTLDLMETFLLSGKAREVRQTAGSIVRLFKDAGMVTGSLTAAGYLKQAAAMSSVTPDLIDHIRKYFRLAAMQPDLAFLPPAL